jgi:hypothetical protein
VLGRFDLEEQAGRGSPCMMVDGDESWVEGEHQRRRG